MLSGSFFFHLSLSSIDIIIWNESAEMHLRKKKNTLRELLPQKRTNTFLLRKSTRKYKLKLKAFTSIIFFSIEIDLTLATAKLFVIFNFNNELFHYHWFSRHFGSKFSITFWRLCLRCGNKRSERFLKPLKYHCILVHLKYFIHNSKIFELKFDVEWSLLCIIKREICLFESK